MMEPAQREQIEGRCGHERRWLTRKPSARIGPSDFEKPYVVVPFSMELICEGLGPPGWYGEEIAGSPFELQACPAIAVRRGWGVLRR